MDEEELEKRFRAGDVRALARAISLVERRDGSRRALEESLRDRMRAPGVAGFTGSPGTGKSTLVDAMVAHLRKQESKVAVLATDPNSPFTGGAILGDRIRMQRHALDPNVFIRSMGARGHLGDSVQMIKAGILEIADVFAVNKADVAGHSNVVMELRAMLSLGAKSGWKKPIVTTIATKGEGIAELWEAVLAHRKYLESSGRAAELKEKWLRDEAAELAAELARGMVRDALESDPSLARRLLEDGTPYRTAEEILGTRPDNEKSST